jgi:UDP-2-acetamido-3-amino-2,3-dideoxy-glucuronate N-acetyltransferase
MPNTRIGENCNFGQNIVVSPGCTIGNNVKVQNNVSIYTGVVIEDDVFCGPSMVFTNVVNPRSHIERKNEYRTTRVGKGASIGANATIVCGHDLGRYCFIGAGAVVTKAVPDYGLIVGNPGRLVGFVCYCGDRLDLKPDLKPGTESVCSSCERHYYVESGRLVPAGHED